MTHCGKANFRWTTRKFVDLVGYDIPASPTPPNGTLPVNFPLPTSVVVSRLSREIKYQTSQEHIIIP